MKEEIRVEASSGNVFEDLGFENARELSIKSKLVMNLQCLMELHKITQREVAERVGTDQPTISKILRGNLDIVSVERLIGWHMKLNQDVSITMTDRFSREHRPEGNVRLEACACP